VLLIGYWPVRDWVDDTFRADFFGVPAITGASSGIGAAYARRLAAGGKNLFLIARRGDRLEALAEELRRSHAATTEVLVADLTKPADIKRVEKRIQQIEPLDMLINNVGFGTLGLFSEIDLAKHLDMINLHVIASTRLCRAALPGMIARNSGTIINVSSAGAFMPTQGNVTYCATKSFLVTFSEALQRELVGTSVKIQALCPGFIQTSFPKNLSYTMSLVMLRPTLRLLDKSHVVA